MGPASRPSRSEGESSGPRALTLGTLSQHSPGRVGLFVHLSPPLMEFLEDKRLSPVHLGILNPKRTHDAWYAESPWGLVEPSQSVLCKGQPARSRREVQLL